MILWIFIFIVALAGLIKSSDLFTDYSEKLGKILGVPQFIIGVTIIALGTSLPELMTSVIAAIDGYTSIVSANVLGSNVANILLVLGIAAIFAGPIVVEKDLIKLDIPILLCTSALLVVNLYDGKFTFIEGIIMVACYLIYILYNYNEHKDGLEEIGDKLSPKPKKEPKLLLLIPLSALGVFIGAHFTVEALINISEGLNIAPSVVAVSAVAIGTSLPELMVSISAARRKNYEMVVGNVIGSNIFNATMVMAIPAFIKPLDVTVDMLTVAIPFLLIATGLFAFTSIERKVFNYEGALFGIIYIVFLGQSFLIAS